MIGIALILGAALIAGGTLIAIFWNKIMDFIKNTARKLEEKFAQSQKLMGVVQFIRKLGNRFQNRTKHYLKDVETGKWKEVIVTMEQEADEIPEEYRRHAEQTDEYDLTPELELQLNQA